MLRRDEEVLVPSLELASFSTSILILSIGRQGDAQVPRHCSDSSLIESGPAAPHSNVITFQTTRVAASPQLPHNVLICQLGGMEDMVNLLFHFNP